MDSSNTNPEVMARDIEHLQKRVDKLQDDVVESLKEKISDIHARISRESNKIATLAALWTVSSLIMVALIYKLFDLTAMLSKVINRSL